MPERRNIYSIDEQLLRNTLLGYSVDFNASHCEAIEQEVASLKMQRSVSLPETRSIMRLVLLPLLIIGSGILLYANADTIRGWFASPVQSTENSAAVNSDPPPAEEQPSANNTPPAAVTKTEVKKDSAAAEPAREPEQAAVNEPQNAESDAKKASPVVALPPSDSVAKTNAKNEEIKSTDSDSASSAPAPVKKKRKRKRHASSIMDELKESTLQPSSADEDVVVPQ